MSEQITIESYHYEELNEEAKSNFKYKMFDNPFDYEDDNGDTKYDYFDDWTEEEQIEYCEINDYLFFSNGTLIPKNIIMEEV